MSSPFSRLTARMDNVTQSRMAKPVLINGLSYPAVDAHALPEMGPINGDGVTLVVFDVAYHPARRDAVSWEGGFYRVERWHRYNGKPQIWLEEALDEGDGAGNP
ncbi:ATP-binding protein [Serratia liquefaciens]|uniref:ATP-binding protein n=1 Tax=Serratia liquefaciens TaxID=614 RepID=UPI0022B9CD0D|nr:ATP-binding protein [Serratia liquefaciens]